MGHKEFQFAKILVDAFGLIRERDSIMSISRKKNLKIIIFILNMPAFSLFAQLDHLHGDFLHIRDGVHSGNLFRTTFYNDGTLGAASADPGVFMGEWPINSGHFYMINGALFVGSEIIDTDMQIKHVFSTIRGGSEAENIGDKSPNGDWWTFLPLPGFASRDTNKVAMTKWNWSWPDVWPDKMDDPVDPGWAGSWNGYFGKNVLNADEESYFIADDYHNAEFKFYPDSTDSRRRGLGMRLWVRGFQWANALVEDGLFNVFDLENIGTHNHDKVVFVFIHSSGIGADKTKDPPWVDGSDDSGGFDRATSSAYMYDEDNIGLSGWSPVGYFGGAFLESPGNPYDGIDNDGDGINGSGIYIDENMFEPWNLGRDDQIVVTDYQTFERRVTTLRREGVDTLRIPWQDLVFKFWAGKKLQEERFDLFDNNLNGLIDENNGATVGEGAAAFITYLYIGYKAVNYISGDGLDNILIDERRDDGIDNDGDWDVLLDDLGADGLADTNDPGENDGLPTAGEPHFDKVDIDESDMIGLTSVSLYRWPEITFDQDEKIWRHSLPGYFDTVLENSTIELLFGSGYFPHQAGTTERFSMGTMCGENLDDFFENVRWFSRAYGGNYNFARPPQIPNVKAIAGDNKVTLIWDTVAEESYDPVTGYDFEGYKIYRSTDPGWNDAAPITDGQGTTAFRKPIAQFDLDDEMCGFHPIPIKGIRFYLGDNTGIVHTWTDTTAVNGQTYFYAVTSYDKGSTEYKIPPSECSKFITLNLAETVEDKGFNVVIARPEAPVAYDVDDIKVVPNPYIVSNSWEPINPYSNGRGPRELHFIHLPPQCTIRIYNIRGALVRELEHDNTDNLRDGTSIWDMLTKDRLDISYGVYIYYVDAGEYGEKIGKFAVIK